MMVFKDYQTNNDKQQENGLLLRILMMIVNQIEMIFKKCNLPRVIVFFIWLFILIAAVVWAIKMESYKLSFISWGLFLLFPLIIQSTSISKTESSMSLHQSTGKICSPETGSIHVITSSSSNSPNRSLSKKDNKIRKNVKTISRKVFPHVFSGTILQVTNENNGYMHGVIMPLEGTENKDLYYRCNESCKLVIGEVVEFSFPEIEEKVVYEGKLLRKVCNIHGKDPLPTPSMDTDKEALRLQKEHHQESFEKLKTSKQVLGRREQNLHGISLIDYYNAMER